MSAAGGGTIRHKTIGRGQLPFEGGGPSGIPRKVETSSQSMPSDAGSTLSASRQKQFKRDEVFILCSEATL